MKKLLLIFLLMPGLLMGAVKVSFKMQYEQEKYAGECVVQDGERMAYTDDNGIEITGDVAVDGPHVTFDLQILKDGEVISEPTFAAFLGTYAKMKIEDIEQNKLLFKFAIVATPLEDGSSEEK